MKSATFIGDIVAGTGAEVKRAQDSFGSTGRHLTHGNAPHFTSPVRYATIVPMTFRLTQELAKRIKLASLDVLPPDCNPFADWCAHEFIAGRKGTPMYPYDSPEAAMSQLVRSTLSLHPQDHP